MPAPKKLEKFWLCDFLRLGELSQIGVGMAAPEISGYIEKKLGGSKCKAIMPINNDIYQCIS